MTNKQELVTEIVVIGAGPGGYAAAFRAADLGKKVVLIDKEAQLGGVCLNKGCIPSKALLHIAKVMTDARNLGDAGIRFTKPRVDLEKVREWKNSVVNQLTSGIAQLAKARKVQTIQGTAQFYNENNLKIETIDGELMLSFKQAIIATGSRSAVVPNFPTDHPGIINSTTALELASIPKRLLVIGGGYIGLEMGTVYKALGSKVSVVEMLDTLLPGADQDLVRILQRRLKADFEEILLNSMVSRIDPNDKGTLSVKIDTGETSATKVYDTVLVAVGRLPNTNAIGLENTGVELTDRGLIIVDKRQRTSVKNIFAIGDVTGDPMLAHKATHEGKIAAEVIAGLPAAFDARAIPAVIFTDPEIAWAGLTETEAKAKNIPYEKGEFPWAASGRSLAIGQKLGKTKLLFDPDSNQVLGIGIVGPSAGDLISEGSLAIEMGADAEDLGLTIHPHPTLSETIANAAEVFTGTVTDLYIPIRKIKK
jgi:dihydrolipoamide dehydrogenase